MYDFSNPTAARHSVRVICDEEGLPLTPTFNVDGKLHLLKDVLCACIEVESGFNPNMVHPNKDTDNKVLSTDYGIAQVNDYWNIGPGKPFPSSDYVLQNPEACVRWMAKMFLAGKESLWVSFTNGSYKKYLP